MVIILVSSQEGPVVAGASWSTRNGPQKRDKKGSGRVEKGVIADPFLNGVTVGQKGSKASKGGQKGVTKIISIM